MISRRNFSLGAAVAPVAPATLARSAFAQETESDFVFDGVELHDVDPVLLPFGSSSDYRVRTGEGFDEDGVRLNRRAGEWQNNPVTQAQYGMLLLAGYRGNGWEENLEFAIANGRRIDSYAEKHDDRTYFPYGFRFYLFGRDDMPLDPPWYSGMAQGQVLQFYSQLFEITGDEFWQQAAESVFNSFREVMNKELPWWPNVDENKNLWFEEYPYDPEQHVFNGHVFAIAGVYEYWRATGDSWAEQLTQGAIRTILDRKEDFRVEGEQSRYALGQPVQHDTYHAVHINQLLFLYALTHDDSFAQTADDFADDWDISATVGSMTLDAGEYNTPEPESVSSLLFMGEDQTSTFESPIDLQVTTRRTEVGTNRVFYNVMTDGEKPFWLEETDSSRLRGKYLGGLSLVGTTIGTLMEFVPARRKTIKAGTYRAFPADSADFDGEPEEMEIPDDVVVELHSRVLISSEPFVLVALDGVGEYWVEWGVHVS